MKKKALMLVIVLAASFLAQATNDNEVIMSIKENYYSIKEKWDDLYKYKSFSNESDISLYSENEVLTAENHFCVVLNERSTIYEYYVKANKLYFVFSNNNGIENRYYFNSNNEIIRWLDNEKLEIVTGLNEKSKSLFNKLILVDSKSDIINEFTSSISGGLSKQIIVDSVKPLGSGLFQVVYEYKNIAFLLIFILLVIILYFKSRTNISATNITESDEQNTRIYSMEKESMKEKGKMYQIKLMGKGVNYVEMLMDKERLDEIGEGNLDAEYFVDEQLINGENLGVNGKRIVDISGVIVESGFKIKIQALDSASKEPEIIDGNDHMEFINDTVDELSYESDEFADVFEDQVEADYNDFDENKVLLQYILVETGPVFQFQMEDFELSKFQLYPWRLERFNDFDIIIGGVYDGKKIQFQFGDCDDISDELRIIHHPDDIRCKWDWIDCYKEKIIEDELSTSSKTEKRGVIETEKNTKAYSDGSKYVGEWNDGKRHGKGVFTKSNASTNLSPGELIVISTYEGEWKDDSKCGEGSFVKEYKDGDNHHSFAKKYEGGWKSDKYHGRGKLTSSTGDIYDGDWKLGIKNGRGVITYTNGNRYEGGMKDGEMHGQGKYSVDGYGIFVGDFVNGVITGKGVFNYSNGEKYDGEWKDAKRHGKGVYTFSDGFEYKGLWDVGFFIDGKKRINVTDSEYKKSKKIADLKFKGKGKYQIKLMGKGVNYIEMWMDKDRLDEIGEENIDAEYFEDNLINGERIIDISGVIVESGFKIKIDALDSASKKPEIIEGNVHMEFINDTVDELCYESDEFADVFEDQAEADYHDFDENKVLIQYIQVERGAYFEFQMEDFELSKFQLYPWCLERFNDFDIIIGGVYDGKKIDFEFGDCTGVRNELRIIHHPDNIEHEWDYYYYLLT